MKVKPENTEIYSEENVTEKSEDSLSESTDSENECDPEIDNKYAEMAREAYAKIMKYNYWTGKIDDT